MIRHLRKFVVNFFKLFTALTFFRLRGADLPYFQYVYPTFLTAGMVLFYNYFAQQYTQVDLSKVVGSATTLMGVLVGFYIAALAAVTSFPNENLDNKMAGDPVRLGLSKDGQKNVLSRRRYLSILLGYCALAAIFVFLLGSLYQAVDLSTSLTPCVVLWIRRLFWIVYIWLVSSLCVSTALCMHYLVDRMHRA